MRSIFLQATKSGWYPEFLSPVVDSVLANPENRQILDIGTGPGTLPKMLITKMSDLKITGIDINKTMIDEARESVLNKNVYFEYQNSKAPLPYADNQFDVITFCSVLFYRSMEVSFFCQQFHFHHLENSHNDRRKTMGKTKMAGKIYGTKRTYVHIISFF